jgi:hypothetical protein
MYSFTILGLDARWRWWSALRPIRFSPEERNPRTHLIEGWVNPRAGLYYVEKVKTPCPSRESDINCLARLSYPGSYIRILEM